MPKKFNQIHQLYGVFKPQGTELTIEGPRVSSSLSFMREFTSAQERCMSYGLAESLAYPSEEEGGKPRSNYFFLPSLT